MTKRPRWVVFLSLAVVASLLACGAFLLFGGKDTPESGLGGDIAKNKPDDTPKAEEAAQEAAIAEALAETTGISTQAAARARKAKETPAPPAPTTDPAAAAWQAYLEQTKATVVNNTASLLAAKDAFTAALAADNGAALNSMLAPDEGATGYGDALTARYPAIESSETLPTVNVFTNGQVTIYFAYVLVNWEDAGILSQHTIPIMFRFVGGQWVITVLGETGSDLTFVQTLTL